MDTQELISKLGLASTKKKTVTIMGLGVVGSAVAEQLARAGINLRIIDRDRVKQEDLASSSLYAVEHVGKFKAKEAKRILEGLNSEIKVRAFHEDVVENNAYLVESNVVVDCSNDLKTSLLIDKAAKKSPVVYVRADGADGHVFIAQDTRIAQASDFLEKYAPSKNSPVAPSAASLVSSLAVNKIFKLLTGEKTEKNCLFVDGWKFSFEKAPVRKNKK